MRKVVLEKSFARSSISQLVALPVSERDAPLIGLSKGEVGFVPAHSEMLNMQSNELPQIRVRHVGSTGKFSSLELVNKVGDIHAVSEHLRMRGVPEQRHCHGHGPHFRPLGGGSKSGNGKGESKRRLKRDNASPGKSANVRSDRGPVGVKGVQSLARRVRRGEGRRDGCLKAGKGSEGGHPKEPVTGGAKGREHRGGKRPPVKVRGSLLTDVGAIKNKVLPVPNGVSTERALRRVPFEEMSSGGSVNPIHPDVSQDVGVFGRELGTLESREEVPIDASTDAFPSGLLVLESTAEEAKAAFLQQRLPKREVSPLNIHPFGLEVSAVKRGAQLVSEKKEPAARAHMRFGFSRKGEVSSGK